MANAQAVQRFGSGESLSDHRPSRPRRRSLSLAGSLASLVCILLSAESANAQPPPEIGPRMVAAFGPPGYEDQPVWESAIAASVGKVVIVFNVGPRENVKGIGYAIWDAQSQSWSEGLVPMGPDDIQAIDPTIAYNAVDDTFIACAVLDRRIGSSRNRYIAVSRLDDDAFEVWRAIAGPADVFSYDKPAIVAGEPMPTGQEFYVVHMENGYYSYAGYAYERSIDGGETWRSGSITLGIGGPVVHGKFCAQPAVAGSGPLYVAYMPYPANEDGASVRFLVGTDIDAGEHAGEVEFAQLNGDEAIGGGYSVLPPPLPVPLTVSIRNGAVGNIVPGSFRILTVPQLAADSSNPDRLFLAYHDIALNQQGERTSDVDVFVRVIIRVEGNDWEAGPPVRVNDDGLDPAEDKDQFLPAILVDDGLNIVFYDDRNRIQYDDDRTGPPKFDVFYARGFFQDGELTFNNFRIPPTSSFPLDFTVSPLNASFEPGEYIGIASPDGGVYCTGFTGTATSDPSADRSVIYTNAIVLPY